MDQEAAFFAEHGYCLLPPVLTPAELGELNAAIDRDRQRYPSLWMQRGEGGRFQTVSALLTQPAFDLTLGHPRVLPLVRRLMGEDVCLEEHSVMVREALAAEAPPALWHRDTAHLAEHPLALRNLSAVFYLTAVDENTHCFAVVPEGVEAKRRLPTDRDARGAVELHGAAGSVILFNAGSCHAGVVKTTPRERRTVHVYYGHPSQPWLSNFTVIPRRLRRHPDSRFRSLFSRPNLNTVLMEENFP